MELSFNDIKERVTSSVFYGTGDEAYELWDSMCRTCYQLASLSQMERASLMVEWIEQDAKESKEFWEKHSLEYLGVPFSEVIFENGKFE